MSYIIIKAGSDRTQSNYNAIHRLKNLDSSTFFKPRAERSASEEEYNAIKSQSSISKEEATTIFNLSDEKFAEIDTDGSGGLSKPEIFNNHLRGIIERQIVKTKAPHFKTKHAFATQDFRTFYNGESSFYEHEFFLEDRQIIMDTSKAFWSDTYTFTLTSKTSNGTNKYEVVFNLDNSDFLSVKSVTQKEELLKILDQIVNDKSVNPGAKINALKISAILN